jgi:hypothetical protein
MTRIERLGPGDEEKVAAAESSPTLFDWTFGND